MHRIVISHVETLERDPAITIGDQVAVVRFNDSRYQGSNRQVPMESQILAVLPSAVSVYRARAQATAEKRLRW